MLKGNQGQNLLSLLNWSCNEPEKIHKYCSKWFGKGSFCAHIVPQRLKIYSWPCQRRTHGPMAHPSTYVYELRHESQYLPPECVTPDGWWLCSNLPKIISDRCDRWWPDRHCNSPNYTIDKGVWARCVSFCTYLFYTELPTSTFKTTARQAYIHRLPSCLCPCVKDQPSDIHHPRVTIRLCVPRLIFQIKTGLRWQL